jgi:hypothetical protein
LNAVGADNEEEDAEEEDAEERHGGAGADGRGCAAHIACAAAATGDCTAHNIITHLQASDALA